MCLQRQQVKRQQKDDKFQWSKYNINNLLTNNNSFPQKCEESIVLTQYKTSGIPQRLNIFSSLIPNPAVVESSGQN